MERILEDFIDQTTKMGSDNEIYSTLHKEMNKEGYANLAVMQSSGLEKPLFIWSDLPVGYENTYLRNDWQSIDPFLRTSNQTVSPFYWRGIEGDARLQDKERTFIKDSRDLMVHSGVTVPFHGPALKKDLINLSMREFKVAESRRLPLIYAMAVQAWLRSSQLHNDLRVQRPVLSMREVECLRWIREGKTNWEISQILSISEKTVEFHTANLMRSLKANSRLAAVLKGLELGIISL